MIRTLLLALTISASAQELSTPIQKDSKYTYADLLRLICPDLKIDKVDPAIASATKSVPIRTLGSKDPPESWDGEIQVENVNTLDAKISGPPQLLLMFDIKADGDDAHHPTGELALFDIAAAPRLLDIVESPSMPDDHGSLWGHGLLHLNPTSDAFVFETNHSNSSQGYQAFTILFVNRGRIRQIADVMLLSCNYCNGGTFHESATISAASNQITIRVVLKLLPNPDYIEHPRRTKTSTRIYSTTYRWNAAKQKYIPTSNALSLLEAFNQKNY
ncbi:MAG TPA: hypothetical protein VEU96_04180 [Bryobacteraceae bacterium]|nr:hypothetical protein [Bryobacteraceae bacterium]